MAPNCPQCGLLIPPPSGRDLLRGRASAWKQLVTTPKKARACPQCHAALYADITWRGYLCLLAGGGALGLTAFGISMCLPVYAARSELTTLLLALPVAIPFFLCYHRLGYVWKLCQFESGADRTPPLAEAAVPPGLAPQWGRIDRALTGIVFLLFALLLTFWALLFVPRSAVCEPGFRSILLLWRNDWDPVPMFWGLSAVTVLGLRQQRRQSILKAHSLPVRFTVSVSMVMWAALCAILLGLYAFTRLHRSMWLNVSLMGAMFAGYFVLAITDQRRRRAHGIPISGREKTRLVFWAILAGAIVLLAILQPKWMQ